MSAYVMVEIDLHDPEQYARYVSAACSFERDEAQCAEA
jgi:uncharacterized protein (DUF1330 family)